MTQKEGEKETDREHTNIWHFHHIIINDGVLKMSISAIHKHIHGTCSTFQYTIRLSTIKIQSQYFNNQLELDTLCYDIDLNNQTIAVYSCL